MDPAVGTVEDAASEPRTIEFYAPGLKHWSTKEWRPTNPRRFLPVSVTGSACALNCDHCGSKVLDGMVSVGLGSNLFDVARRLKAAGSQGILVSGGSTKRGFVPLARHLPWVPRIRDELDMRVVVHTGVVTPPLAAQLADAGVDAVMLDIIGADATIREVYHLDLSVDDFDRALGLLDDTGLRVIPHVVIGLHYGRILGEYRALELIARHRVDTLILVVLTPLVGTPMGHLPPPSLEATVEVFRAARTLVPSLRTNLGCARPMGTTKVALDRAAVDLGFAGIAYPAEGTIAYAREQGLTPVLHEWCCSMSWAGVDDDLTTVRVS